MAALLLATSNGLASDAASPSRDSIVVFPAATTAGGTKRLAQVIRDALVETGIPSSVDSELSPGAGGTIGLAQFLARHGSDARALLIGGLSTVSVADAESMSVSLGETTPLARLIGEYEVIATPAASGLTSLHQLVHLARTEPAGIVWTGTYQAGADQVFVTRFAETVGASPQRMRFVPSFDRNRLGLVDSERLRIVRVSNYANLAPRIRSGELRALAIASDTRLPGLEIPTLKEQGVALRFVHWRGVFGAPNLSSAQRRSLLTALDRMVRTNAWRAAIATHRWEDLYLPGQPFEAFVANERGRSVAASRSQTSASAQFERPVPGLWLLHNGTGLLAASLAGGLGLVTLLVWRERAAAQRRRDLAGRRKDAEQQLAASASEFDRMRERVANDVIREFQVWGLTAAEQQVALELIKGAPLRDIASARGSRESTVRHQALAVYRKARVDGRGSLAAYFLEDLL